MREVLEIGAIPAEEACEQLGPNYNPVRARKECTAYMNQLRRQFGEEPEGASLFIKANPHDFGTYLEVACRFDSSNRVAAAYAYACESKAWSVWDDVARAELLAGGVAVTSGIDSE